MIKNIYKIHPFLQEDINNLIKDDIFSGIDSLGSKNGECRSCLSH